MSFKNPDRQLRDFGAFMPAVSFSRNVSSWRSRHPVIVTTAGVGSGAFAADSSGAFPGAMAAASLVAGAAPGEGVFEAEAFFAADSSGGFTGVMAAASLVAGVVRAERVIEGVPMRDGPRAAISIAAATTPITTRNMAAAPNGAVKRGDLCRRGDFFTRADFFTRRQCAITSLTRV